MTFIPSEKLRHIPCTFNLDISIQIPQQRLQYTEQLLKEDLESTLPGAERVRNLNLLSWVTFYLGNDTEAFDLNKQALEDSVQNLTAMANEIFINYERGDDRAKAEQLFNTFKSLEQLENFEKLKLVARAEQAYCYIRLNLMQSYKHCKHILSESIKVFKDNYLWKLDLGFLCTRILHYNVQFTGKEATNRSDLLAECVSLLMEVGDKGDHRLRGLAFSELVVLRQQNYEQEMDEIFRNLTLIELCSKAEKYGEKNHAVLCQCGKSLKNIDINRAINLLEKSINLRKSSKAFANLGICFVRKADLIACGKYRPQRSGVFLNNRMSAANAQKVYQLKNNQRLKLYVKQNLTPLKENDELVLKAIQYFKKSLQISFEENMPTRLNLGQLYFKIGRYKEALAEFQKIIDRSDSNVNYLITLISAHDLAGKCFLELNKVSKSRENLEKANNHFYETISLASGLASRYPIYEYCITEIWEAFKTFLNDFEEMNSHVEEKKEKLNLQSKLEYIAMFREIDSMLQADLDVTVEEKLPIILIRCLIDGHYEKALAYFKMAMMKGIFRQAVVASSELLALRSKIYIGTIWRRLLNGCTDCTSLFQQMFEQRYGQRDSNQSKNDNVVLEAGQIARKDLLILYHEAAESTGSDRFKLLAENLFQVAKVLYGLQASTYSVISTETRSVNKEPLTQEMVNYSVTLLILDDSSTESSFNEIITAVHNINGSKVFIISCNPACPIIREGCSQINLTEEPWSQTRLVHPPVDMEGQEDKIRQMSCGDVVKKMFNEDVEAVMRLFCFIVGEEFENIRENCHPHLKK